MQKAMWDVKRLYLKSSFLVIKLKLLLDLKLSFAILVYVVDVVRKRSFDLEEGDLGQITIDEEDDRSWPLETLIFTVFLPLIISK